MIEKALITSASNKFFPSLVNLLGSIHANYPTHPDIFVYDLGLSYIFRKELEKINWVKLVKMPEFVPFWRACYTWKTYILSHPLARLNFYLDAGCQVLRPLDEIFEEIERKDLFVMNQGVKFVDILPKEYKNVFELSDEYDQEDTVHAGEIGFKARSSVSSILENTYQSAIAGLALGFSPGEEWRNKGRDKNPYVRFCKIFRHDMTLLNIWFKKYFGKNIPFQDVNKYGGGYKAHPEQVIWNLRLSYKSLDYAKIMYLHDKKTFAFICNRLIISTMVSLKNFNLKLKKTFGIIKN